MEIWALYHVRTKQLRIMTGGRLHRTIELDVRGYWCQDTKLYVCDVNVIFRFNIYIVKYCTNVGISHHIIIRTTKTFS